MFFFLLVTTFWLDTMLINYRSDSGSNNSSLCIEKAIFFLLGEHRKTLFIIFIQKQFLLILIFCCNSMNYKIKYILYKGFDFDFTIL